MQSGWHSHYTSVSSLKCLQINNLFCFFFNDTATTEIYTLSLHDALPISERALEGVLAEHRVAQHGEHQRGLLIRRPREVALLHRLVDERLLVAGDGRNLGGAEQLAPDRVTVGRTPEIAFGRAVVDERVEPFVHPRIAPLVGADHHREPLVPELVREHPELVFPLLDRRYEGEHGILHALDESFHRGRLRPGVHPPRLAEVLDREPRHLVGFFPRGGAGPI